MKALHAIAFILLVIGGLNWLVLAIWGWDISHLFGGPAALTSKIIYILVGIAAIVEVLTHKSNCKNCQSTS